MGGTSAAGSAGVKDKLFKQHGWWKSESVKDGNLEETLQKLLMVSKNLGIWTETTLPLVHTCPDINMKMTEKKLFSDKNKRNNNNPTNSWKACLSSAEI